MSTEISWYVKELLAAKRVPGAGLDPAQKYNLRGILSQKNISPNGMKRKLV
jgi:hypothetical protein